MVVAIGHTHAAPPRIRDAIRAGAKLSTHLGNGSHALLPRHENYCWEQLAADELTASIITDGHHLPAPLIHCLFRVKRPGRLIVTCDASAWPACPPGITTGGPEAGSAARRQVVVPGTTFLGGSGVLTDSPTPAGPRRSKPDRRDRHGRHPRRAAAAAGAGAEGGDASRPDPLRAWPEEPFEVKETLIGGRPA